MTRPELRADGATGPHVVAVTGATGFIGGHLVRLLVERGWQPRILIRSLSSLDGLPQGIEIVPGDLDDRWALRRLVNGVAAVIHLAGAIKAADPADFWRVNAEGSAAVAEACRSQTDCGSLILVSSLAAREPQLSAYAASKRQGERVVAQLGQGLPWAAIRAPVVYGPGDHETLAIFRLASRRVAPIAGGGKGRLSMIHVGDLARVIVDLLGHPAPGIYEIDDGAPDGYSLAEIFMVAGEAAGRRPALVAVPRAAMTALAILTQLVARSTARPAILTTGKVREMWHADWVARDHRLADMLGFQPRFDIHSGFRDTIAWYKEHNWL